MNRSVTGALLGSASVLLTGLSHAQQATAPSTAGAENTDRIAEVVVTARRREESLQEVPLAITALSGAELAQANIFNTWDLKTKVPGLAVQDSAYGSTVPVIGIRGQIQKQNQGNQSQSVGVYVNEVIVSRLPGLTSGLYDVESVQVLKGPQGTLFGRNTPGGAVLYTTVLPGKAVEGYARATFGDYNLHRLESAATLPASDEFSVRVAGRYSERDGYLKNINTGHDVRSEDEVGGRVTAVFTPTDGIKNTTILDYARATPYPSGLKLYYLYPNAAGASRQPYLNALSGKDFYTVNVNDRKAEVTNVQASNTTAIEISDALTIKNIAGYRRTRSNVFGDFDGMPIVAGESTDIQRMNQYSDEFQVLGSLYDDNLSWITGVFWLRESGDNAVISANSPTVTQDSRMHVVSESTAVYAQGTWKLPFYRALSATVGGRYTWDSQDADWAVFLGGNCNLRVANSGAAALNPCAASDSADFHQPTYTVALDWKPIDDLLLYVTTRRGYRAGGFDIQVTTPASREPFKPEKVTDYEGGVKYAFRAGGTEGRINAAVYRTDYKDMQRLVPTLIVENGSTLFISRTTNAASAKIDGFEVDAVWVPIPAIELSATYGQVEPRYKRFVSATGENRGLNAFSSTPEETYSAGIKWALPTPSSIGDVSLRLDYYHQALSYTQDNNTNLVTGQRFFAQTIPAYGTYSLRADWNEFLKPNLDLSAYVRNLSDRHYYVAGTDLTAALGSGAMAPGEPRNFGVQLNYRF